MAARLISGAARGSRWSTSSPGRSSSGWWASTPRERRDALRDDTRTNAPILIFDPGSNTYVRTTPFGRRSFRGDFLFAYQPTPGTVLFAGYGSTLRDPSELGRSSLRRMEDGFFLKLSYLFQM